MYEEYNAKYNYWYRPIDALHTILSGNQYTNKRPINTNTNNPQVKDTTFYKYLTSEEVVKQLSKRSKDNNNLRLPSPFLSIFPGYQFNILEPLLKEKYEADILIDLMIANPDLAQAKTDCLNFALKVIEVIKSNKNLNGTCAYCYVKTIQDYGFREEPNLPYEKFYRLILSTKYS